VIYLNFSERENIEIKNLQMKEVNQSTRVGLWNLITTFYLNEKIIFFERYKLIYTDILKQTIDTFPIQDFSDISLPIAYFTSYTLGDIFPEKKLSDDEKKEMLENYRKRRKILYERFYKIHIIIREYFFKCRWNKVYDFLEYVMSKIDKNYKIPFANRCNDVFIKEKTAYRFDNSFEISPLINKLEQDVVIKVLSNSNEAIKGYINKAYSKLKERENENYNDVAEEAIKAVESFCKTLTEENTPTLGDAVKILRKKKEVLNISDLFLVSIEKLYAWASSTFRHGQEENIPIVEISEAKFVLIICSEIINYLQVKFDNLKKINS